MEARPRAESDLSVLFSLWGNHRSGIDRDEIRTGRRCQTDRYPRRSDMGNSTVYVTPEGLKKLEDELEHLRTVKRQEVAQRLHEAMEDGELIENAEYEAAKNEQAFVEGRILEPEHT